MGRARTSSAKESPRPRRLLPDLARAVGRLLRRSVRRTAAAIPMWRAYGRFLQTSVGQGFLDRGRFLGAASALVMSPSVEPDVPWADLPLALSEARVALVSTAGVHLASDPPFDVDSPLGDPTFRVVPASAHLGRLSISHTHYGHQRAERDLNVVFPLERLQRLAADGFIGEVSPRAYSFGFTVQTDELIDPEVGTAQELARRLLSDGVDAVLLVPA